MGLQRYVFFSFLQNFILKNTIFALPIVREKDYRDKKLLK